MLKSNNFSLIFLFISLVSGKHWNYGRPGRSNKYSFFKALDIFTCECCRSHSLSRIPYAIYIFVWTMMITTINEIQMVHTNKLCVRCACEMKSGRYLKHIFFSFDFFLLCYSVIFIINIIFKHFLFGNNNNNNKKILHNTVRMNAAVAEREWVSIVVVVVANIEMDGNVMWLFSFLSSLCYAVAHFFPWNLQFSFVIKCCSVIYLVIYGTEKNSTRNRNAKLK